MRGSGLFRNRAAAAAALSTVALLVALEVSDSLTRTSADDDVRDQSTVAFFGAAMATAIAASGASLVRNRPLPRRSSLWWSGIGLLWAGAAINRTAKRELGQNYRARLTLVAGHEVVTGGPYRLVRHPMYSGACLICVGASLTVASPASVTWALPIASLIHRINVEEAMLLDALGGEYDDFALARSRLVPGLW